MATMQETLLVQVVVYRKPRDYPNHFVVREWLVRRDRPEPEPALEVALFETLQLAQDYVEARWPDLVCIDRMPGDDPAIAVVYT